MLAHYRLLYVIASLTLYSCARWRDGAKSTQIAAAERAPTPEVLVQHGLQVGDSIATVSLRCADGIPRVIAPKLQLQLITFSTLGDCSACHAHISGLESLLRSGRISVNHLYVSFAATSEQPSAIRAYRLVTNQPVCWDGEGSLWDRYHISHTPVTVLLDGGSIVFMNDVPLTSADAQQRFVEALTYFERTSLSDDSVASRA
jgi:hypothetical protein